MYLCSKTWLQFSSDAINDQNTCSSDDERFCLRRDRGWVVRPRRQSWRMPTTVLHLLEHKMKANVLILANATTAVTSNPLSENFCRNFLRAPHDSINSRCGQHVEQGILSEDHIHSVFVLIKPKLPVPRVPSSLVTPRATLPTARSYFCNSSTQHLANTRILCCSGECLYHLLSGVTLWSLHDMYCL